ncbi:DedA family protein [Micromonospora sp. CPCC 206061]|uniref:DedA family protein n=1 Tax=Micromonospora sp. CPCC 206061 TaxID=3122410 RepID=UPI002FF42655
MLELLSGVASPVAAYLLLMALLWIDAFVPIVPTQAVMITGGALTVYGGLNLPLIVAVGALGVFCGDLACYLLGRLTRQSRSSRPQMGAGRVRATAERLTRGLRRPGPVTIFLCRFVPGGRMAACFHAGRMRYPYRLFLPYEGAAALAWAAYGGLVGHLGGAALTASAWRLFAVAATAATIFAAAGWALALTGHSHWRPGPRPGEGHSEHYGAQPLPEGRSTPVREASVAAPPR